MSDLTALKYRWVHGLPSLADDAGFAAAVQVMKRAAAAGYNGIVESWPAFTHDRDPEGIYRNRLREAQREARALGLEFIPSVMPVGYAHALLHYDSNLLEGMPVKDALFVVRNGQADVADDPPVTLINGGFESAQDDRFEGWVLQDVPGRITFADRAEFHSGGQSLRIENFDREGPTAGFGRVMQTVRVAPYRHYHFSVWLKTDGFQADTEWSDSVLTVRTSTGRSLAYQNLKSRGADGWVQYHATFNSLDNDHIHVFLGPWEGRSGRIWFDDAALEEVGLFNVIRRAGCPLTVRGEDGTVYEEGRDFEPVRDPELGTFSAYREPMPLHLTPNSRIADGQRLRVSFYHTILIYSDQLVPCLSDPGVFSVFEDFVARAEDLFHPAGFFMGHDEIRIANQCALCRERGMTPGEMLADNVRRCIGLIRDRRPDADIFVWSDMFDPFHNAVAGPYYLVEGSWAGSWEGLDPSVIIVNWYYDIRKRNLPWFTRLGNRQILAGYYDSDPGYIRTWLDDARGVADVVGVIYTTWQARFDDLEAFARAAWGGDDS